MLLCMLLACLLLARVCMLLCMLLLADLLLSFGLGSRVRCLLGCLASARALQLSMCSRSLRDSRLDQTIQLPTPHS
jgi:hypothetical protein